jgi:hypothetical protein
MIFYPGLKKKSTVQTTTAQKALLHSCPPREYKIVKWVEER